MRMVMEGAIGGGGREGCSPMGRLIDVMVAPLEQQLAPICGSSRFRPTQVGDSYTEAPYFSVMTIATTKRLVRIYEGSPRSLKPIYHPVQTARIEFTALMFTRTRIAMKCDWSKEKEKCIEETRFGGPGINFLMVSVTNYYCWKTNELVRLCSPHCCLPEDIQYVFHTEAPGPRVVGNGTLSA